MYLQQLHAASGTRLQEGCACSLLHAYLCPLCHALCFCVCRRLQTSSRGTLVRRRLLRAGLLFDWLYPAHLPTLRACLEAWADSPDVTTPALKFMAELAYNKTQRLTFDSSSPNGILLFREVSKVRCSRAAGRHASGSHVSVRRECAEPG